MVKVQLYCIDWDGETKEGIPIKGRVYDLCENSIEARERGIKLSQEVLMDSGKVSVATVADDQELELPEEFM